ncbi:hypothetical protein BAE44_0002378, partial [Dichanthelium oligosanthes]
LVQGGHRLEIRRPPRGCARPARVWRQRRARRGGALVPGVLQTAVERRGRRTARGGGRPRRPQIRRPQPRSCHAGAPGEGRHRRLRLRTRAGRRPAHVSGLGTSSDECPNHMLHPGRGRPGLPCRDTICCSNPRRMHCLFVHE